MEPSRVLLEQLEDEFFEGHGLWTQAANLTAFQVTGIQNFMSAHAISTITRGSCQPLSILMKTDLPFYKKKH